MYVATVRMHSGTCVIWGHLGTNQKRPDYQGVLILQVSLMYNETTQLSD